MKAFICLGLLFLSVAVSAQTGIGTSTPDASAQLDVVSTSKGILVPRMTKTQRNAIASPATGLLIYQSTDSTGFYFYNGTSWTYLHAGVLSVANGGTGASSVSGAKTNLGLDNVDNTSDANKPISTATQAALDLKANTADILNYAQANFLQLTDTAAMLGNYVNRTTDQTIAGAKSFNSDITVNNIPIGNGNLGYLGLSIGTTSPGGRSGTGLLNTAIGYYNMLAITTGELNTAIGPNALIKNSIGDNNTATGVLSIENNISGNNNTAIGYESLKNNVTGNNNTALGAMAGVDSVNLSNTTAVGYMARADSSNMMQLGNSSLNLVRTSGKLKLGAITFPNTDGTDGQVLSTNGSGTVSWSTPSSISMGSISASSTANGASITNGELNLAPADATNGGVVTTGAQTFAGAKTFTSNLSANGVHLGMGGGAGGGHNTAVGNGALVANNDGDGANTAVGFSAMTATTSGAYNSALGDSALGNNTTGSYNTAIGNRSLLYNTTGNHNTAIGLHALLHNTSSDNVAVGVAALRNNTSGYGNVAIGYGALINQITGNWNIALGTFADVFNGASNAIALGDFSIAELSNLIQLGNNEVTLVRTSGQLKLGEITFPNTDGTNGQVLTTDGSGNVSWQNPSAPVARDVQIPVREVADEFVFAGGSSGFELTQIPAADSKVKMFINGMRVSNAAYAVSGTTVTYDSTKNKDIILRKGDVVQFDFYY